MFERLIMLMAVLAAMPVAEEEVHLLCEGRASIATGQTTNDVPGFLR